MANNDVVRIPGEVMPRLEEGSDVDSVDSGSISQSNPNSSSNSDASARPDSDSDGDSATSEVSDVDLDSFADGRLVRVHDDQSAKNGFLSVMSRLGLQTTVESVYKNSLSGFTWQAKLRSFLEISRNMEKTGEGLGKVTYAWFGGSKDEINSIFQYGFAARGRGIRLSPYYSPIPSLRGCVADENGLYHMILCRAILGRSEIVSPTPSAQQQFPSSEEFHSGVDNLSSPHLYLVWSSYMNTHVMPTFVVSFRPPVKAKEGASNVRPPVPAKPVRASEGVANAATSREPIGMIPFPKVVLELASEGVANAATSREPIGMIPFPKVVLELASVLPANIISSLQKGFSDYREGKVTKMELTEKLIELTGRDLLFRTIMSIRRRNGASKEAAPGDSNNVVTAQRKAGARSSAKRVLKKLKGARPT